MIKKALIVEDDEALAYIFSDYMRETGTSSDWARDGREAIEISSCNNYDLVLMDIQMPRLGGIEATSTIMSLKPNSVVIGVTSSDDSLACKSMISAGAKECLTKPLTLEKLNRILSRYFPTPNIG